jgi:hypothetical protein
MSAPKVSTEHFLQTVDSQFKGRDFVRSAEFGEDLAPTSHPVAFVSFDYSVEATL